MKQRPELSVYLHDVVSVARLVSCTPHASIMPKRSIPPDMLPLEVFTWLDVHQSEADAPDGPRKGVGISTNSHCAVSACCCRLNPFGIWRIPLTASLSISKFLRLSNL